MQFDLSQPILNKLTKEPFKFEKEELTLKMALYHAMAGGLNRDIPGKEKYEMGKIADKLLEERPDFSLDEVTKLKEYSGMFWNLPPVVQQIWDMLEKPMSATGKKEVKP